MEYLLRNAVVARIGIEKYKCTVEWRNGKFIADESEKSGGKGLGPDPYTLLLSSVATCVLATLRMYIDRKGWDIPDVAVAINMYQEIKDEKKVTVIDRDLNFFSTVTSEQRERLIQIAKVCPISKMLEGEIQMHTFAYRDNPDENNQAYSN